MATHTARRELYEAAGSTVMDITRSYHDRDNGSVLPRAIASHAAFSNAMTLDIAMGGSSNTILHLLAAAQEAELVFTLDDIDAISRATPCLAKLAPNGEHLVEDVHRAGGNPAILGELDRAGLLDHSVRSVHSDDLRSWLTSGMCAEGRPAPAPWSSSTTHRVRALRDGLLPIRAVGVAGFRPDRRAHPLG